MLDSTTVPRESASAATVECGVTADKRSADDSAVAACEREHQLCRRSIGRERGVCYLVEKGHAGREELGQNDPLSTASISLVGQGLASAQILRSGLTEAARRQRID